MSGTFRFVKTTMLQVQYLLQHHGLLAFPKPIQGMKFEYYPDRSVEYTQQGLTKKILETVGTTDCNPK